MSIFCQPTSLVKTLIKDYKAKAALNLHNKITRMGIHSGGGVTPQMDQTQLNLLKEECILVNEHDQKIGHASKRECHLLENINKGMLHRAFSVFLFNTQNELLLQKRSHAKITFPDHWTNTCCSHPLNTSTELEEKDSLGVKRAAQRKLNHELGIEPHQIPIEKFHFLTRILYKSENVPHDGVWGEHEIDHILVLKADVDLVANDNEVQDCRYVNRTQLQQLIKSSESDGTLVTPWFRLIVDNFLYKWWDNVDQVDTQQDVHTIHRMS